ncbi:MAG: acetyl-CoA carboxylase biotin carboxylase subunit [Chloroflexota bacterium]|nr:acetyl-CoA carboxylase biotin carboxylase subunit [Chloroflexota bacterium]
MLSRQPGVAPLGFSTVLIANRGEIAVRIAQTCRERGLRTIAVYSEADVGALHVRMADEAYLIGPAPSLHSYLSIDALLRAARESGADAVHPGYGFLAENADFARAVEDAGLIWIGPPADVIAALGDKVAAKALAVNAGVPVVPGYAGEDQSPERMVSEAERIGFPVMLKAAAGGGGRGMRQVHAAEGLPAALEGAKREAQSAFGDDRVFMEKLLVRPRHIEIQLMVDQHGNGVYLGERDCSLQRRHQKVIEEAPSPVLTPELRAAMGRDALRLAGASGYVNAGTVEFLFSGDSYYFLEMNTRIQVEHPVTEMVTGLDLVALQLAVAAGQRLPLHQSEVELRGHAIEARIYAEDPARGFLPAIGRVTAFVPPEGSGIRNDTGISAGAEVTPFYDAMLSKLVVHAPDRSQALARLQQALQRYVMAGITTNLEFLQWIVNHEEVIRGRVDTGWLEREWHPAPEVDVPVAALAAAAAFESSDGYQIPASEKSLDPWRRMDTWRGSGSVRRFLYATGDGAPRGVELTGSPPSWSARVDGSENAVGVKLQSAGAFTVEVDDAEEFFRVSGSGDGVRVAWAGGASADLRHPAGYALLGGGTGAKSDAGLTAPMPGTVVKVQVTEGQTVAAHEPLMVLEAMKMEHVVEAPYAGVIKAILFQQGDMVPASSPVVRMEPA